MQSFHMDPDTYRNQSTERAIMRFCAMLWLTNEVTQNHRISFITVSSIGCKLQVQLKRETNFLLDTTKMLTGYGCINWM